MFLTVNFHGKMKGGEKSLEKEMKMKMEIEVKAIGTARGTVGWLAKGLKDGSLIIREGSMKSTGNHGLWLKDKMEGIDGKKHDGKLSQFLAAFNPYGLDHRYDGPEYSRYSTADDEDREGLWSDAAWESLMVIARQWCDQMNTALKAEEPLTVALVRAVAS